jgi:hypothetical protein
MSDYTISPFVVGAEVVIETHGYDYANFIPTKVAKVHKSGRIVLERSTQQYRVQAPDSWDKFWKAEETGNGWRKDRVYLLDDRKKAEIAERLALRKRKNEIRGLCDDIYRFRVSDDVTDEQVNALKHAHDLLFSSSPISKQAGVNTP